MAPYSLDLLRGVREIGFRIYYFNYEAKGNYFDIDNLAFSPFLKYSL
jgi:hypothetical protein